MKFLQIAARSALAFSAVLLLGSPIASQDVDERAQMADKGFSVDNDRPARWFFDDHKKLSTAINKLLPQRKGVVDAYVVVAGIDADPVFGRETAATSKVLSTRYDAVGRTITLAAGTGANDATLANGSITNLMTALGAVAAKMDLKEDVLILYTTSHGGQGVGIVYQDRPNGFGMISPSRMGAMINGMGFTKRLIMVSACYSGAFVAPLKSDESIIITAASDSRSSFGCHPGNDWTFFGDALINTAMRTPKPLDTTVTDAFGLIKGWEDKMKLSPSSDPQFSVGSKTAAWLGALEKRMPKITTQRVGKPAIGE